MATTKFSTIVGQAQVVPVLDTAWTTYTGAVSGGGAKTLTALLLKYRQRLNGIEIAFSISGNNVASGGGSTTVSFPVPSGMTIDYTALPTASVGSDLNDEGFGYEYSISTLTAYTPLSAIVPVSATNIGFIRLGASFITSGNLNSTNQPQITGKVWVPIVGLSPYVAQGAGLATASRPGIVYRSPQTTIVPSATGFTSFTVIRAIAIAYMDNNGVWRMTFNLSCTFASISCSTFNVSIAGTVFKNLAGFVQPVVAAYGTAALAPRGLTQPNTGDILVSSPATTASGIHISGDVELDGKPSWA